jgi:hypothetical protein
MIRITANQPIERDFPGCEMQLTPTGQIVIINKISNQPVALMSPFGALAEKVDEPKIIS